MIRVVVAGTSPFGLPSFTNLLNDPAISLVGAISQPARPAGRHQTIEPTVVAAWATENNLPLLTPANWKQAADVEALRAWKPDVIVVAAYGVIVPVDFLTIPTHGCINLHASILPRYRGASPVAAAILAGDEATGVSYMLMDVGLDTGDVLSEVRCSITPKDTTPILTERLAQLAGTKISKVVGDFVAGKLTRTIQPPGASYAKKISRADGLATWSSATQLERMSRAYTPWPSLWTTWQTTTIKILSGQATPGPVNGPLGTVISLANGRWAVQCADGLFLPTEVQFAGKQAQPAASIPGNYPGFIGSQLGR